MDDGIGLRQHCRVADRPVQRAVEDSLGSRVPEGIVGVELGEAIVKAVEDFVFRDIENDEQADQLFSFITDDDARTHLATAFRGSRWQQKMGLVFARPVAHPAHLTQVRTQLVEYGGIAETSLRCVLIQNGKDDPPADFDGLIKKARAAGLLSIGGAASAEWLRLARNRVHLFLDASLREVRAEREARTAFIHLSTVLNECRSFHGLPPWHFGRISDEDLPGTPTPQPGP